MIQRWGETGARSLLEQFDLFRAGTKYIWDLALDKSGNLYIATGDHGEIYKVTPKGDHAVFFRSDETHIRVLAFDAKESHRGDGWQRIGYRISPEGEGFVLYSAPKKEITALALDREGNIYAAGVGEKRPSGTSTSSGFFHADHDGCEPTAPTVAQMPGRPGRQLLRAPSTF